MVQRERRRRGRCNFFLLKISLLYNNVYERNNITDYINMIINARRNRQDYRVNYHNKRVNYHVSIVRFFIAYFMISRATKQTTSKQISTSKRTKKILSSLDRGAVSRLMISRDRSRFVTFVQRWKKRATFYDVSALVISPFSVIAHN